MVVVELPSVGHVRVAVVDYFDGALLALPCGLHVLVVALYRLHHSHIQKPEMRDTQRRPHFEDAIDDFPAQNDGVLHVKHMILRDLEQ